MFYSSADEMDDEVVYMEEQNEFVSAYKFDKSSSRPRIDTDDTYHIDTYSNSFGNNGSPVRKIFGTTPAAGGINNATPTHMHQVCICIIIVCV